MNAIKFFCIFLLHTDKCECYKDFLIHCIRVSHNVLRSLSGRTNAQWFDVNAIKFRAFFCYIRINVNATRIFLSIVYVFHAMCYVHCLAGQIHSDSMWMLEKFSAFFRNIQINVNATRIFLSVGYVFHAMCSVHSASTNAQFHIFKVLHHCSLT